MQFSTFFLALIAIVGASTVLAADIPSRPGGFPPCTVSLKSECAHYDRCFAPAVNEHGETCCINSKIGHCAFFGGLQSGCTADEIRVEMIASVCNYETTNEWSGQRHFAKHFRSSARPFAIKNKTRLSPQLPQELIDSIIELVCVNSLCACALTATSFVQPSQRRIFNWMSLFHLSQYEGMAIILAKSPHLGKYVKLLALQIAHLPADSAPLKLILSTMTELERLTISGDTAGSPMTSRLRLNPCLVDTLDIPSLLCFGLADLVDVSPFVVAQALETCEEVILSRIFLARHGSLDDNGNVVEVDPLDTLVSPPEPGFLWHLSVMDSTEEIFPFLFSPTRMGYFQKLVRLSWTILPVSENNVPAFTAALATCAPTLEHLEIEYSTPFAMPTFPELWHLELWIHADSLSPLDTGPFSFPAAVLLGLSSTPNLEELTIAVREHPPGAHTLSWGALPFSPTTATEWETLDNRLMEMHKRRSSRNSEDVPNAEDAQGREPQASSDVDGDDDALPDDEHDDEPDSALVGVHLALRHFFYDDYRYTRFMADMKQKLPKVDEAGVLLFSSRATLRHPMDRCILGRCFGERDLFWCLGGLEGTISRDNVQIFGASSGFTKIGVVVAELTSQFSEFYLPYLGVLWEQFRIISTYISDPLIPFGYAWVELPFRSRCGSEKSKMEQTAISDMLGNSRAVDCRVELDCCAISNGPKFTLMGPSSNRKELNLVKPTQERKNSS
ncbi:hypothetical protein R3P38DRAFT_3348143 [Favolaschia claudopus]|uniref:Uncharacterized protein n=1 Tax=Favolaschia claudopus TaxID=2862362 RepID=A0AAW0CT46_9AGAR